MKAFGRRVWAIPEGYIPSGSVSDAHDLASHEAACFLNTGDREADIMITLFFKDCDPVGPYRLKVGSKRTVHMRFDDLRDSASVPVIPVMPLSLNRPNRSSFNTRVLIRVSLEFMLSTVEYSEGE